MKPTFKIFPRIRSIKQNGEVPFYLRVTINRRSRWLSLNLSFTFPDVIKFMNDNKGTDRLFPDETKYWDEKHCKVKPYPNVNPLQLKQVNQELEKFNSRSRTVIHKYNIIDKLLTFDQFEAELWTIKTSDARLSFYQFSENEIVHMTEIKAPAETTRTFSSLISKLKKYKDPLYFEDITLEFLRTYHTHMIIKLKNKENTCSKTFRFMRNMINRAINQNILSENVFNRFQIKSEPGHREFLTENELTSLEKLHMKGTGIKYLDNVLRYFLFACYTGLRYQDIKKLRFVDLKNETVGEAETLMIRIIMHKTHEAVSVPIIPKAKALIGETGFVNQKVFRVSTNQVTNRHLKKIITKAEIVKNITFHCARHTFATHCLNLGFPMEVVGAILGHTDLKTTKVYAKIVDSRKIHHMSKWN